MPVPVAPPDVRNKQPLPVNRMDRLVALAQNGDAKWDSQRHARVWARLETATAEPRPPLRRRALAIAPAFIRWLRARLGSGP